MAQDTSVSALLTAMGDDVKNASVIATFTWASLYKVVPQQTLDLCSAFGLHMDAPLLVSGDITPFCEEVAGRDPQLAIQLAEKYVEISQALNMPWVEDHIRSVFHQLPQTDSTRMETVYKSCEAHRLARLTHS